jgi:hypothetical protein
MAGSVQSDRILNWKLSHDQIEIQGEIGVNQEYRVY